MVRRKARKRKVYGQLEMVVVEIQEEVYQSCVATTCVGCWQEEDGQGEPPERSGCDR